MDAAGVGVVAGLELADGRAVVAKVHRTTFIARGRLEAIVRVQADLAAADVPAPAPLAGPLTLGDGWLTVEAHRGGDPGDGHDPAVRRGMAAALHVVAAARLHADDGGRCEAGHPGPSGVQARTRRQRAV